MDEVGVWREKKFYQQIVVSLVTLSFKPLQGLRVSPSWACGGTGGARDGAELHIKKGCEV